ncbi:type VI secretion protein [Massilia sp. KIM]|uniref:type VI secretion system baseplate subunit TssE n=1 Tax=Massilia sp. KIM TaxID=1955422 RepID=UPI00098FDDAE|nr:type VI secretion system baseplate subunit TssE [Massilia sp. KIM]OON62793.1 type VI secretion protein [Massilia sp. KIM]
MQGYVPGLLDRLMDGPSHGPGGAGVARVSIEELKDSVARDLEALLNTRIAMPELHPKRFPECRRSLVTYGLHDFAGLSLSSFDDRAHICACLEQAIARHEPRLRNVRASLELREDAVNCLNFSITALLVVHAAQEPVNFDAILQPASQHYTISRARRSHLAGA